MSNRCMRSRVGLIGGLMSVLLALACAETTSGADAKAVLAEIAPALDGKLGDACWRNAAPYTEFTAWRQDTGKLDDTTFRLAYDNMWLYIGLECRNPLQKLIFSPKVIEHDGAVNTDESVEIFLDPGTDGRLYYHFFLSCFNIKAEQSVQAVPALVRNRTWDHPWRAAVQRSDMGWTAELAIPLHLIASYGDFEKVRINIIRNRLAPSMDAQGVITHDDRYSSSWQAAKRSFHEPESFGRVAPFLPERLQVPFMPSLVRSDIGSCYLKGNDRFFQVSAEIRGATDRTGELELVVVDRPSAGKVATVRERFTLKGRELKRIALAVPMTSIADRRVDITLRDAANGEIWGRDIVENPPALNVLNVYLDRNYYTSEEHAVLVAEIGLPPESLKGLTMLVRGPDGAVLGRGDAVTAETNVSFPLVDLGVGKHTIGMELRRAGRAAAGAAPVLSRELQLDKRAPKPGREWKIDQINRVLLKPDGKPIFPFGPVMAGCTPDNEDAFRQLAEGGFNTFFQWHRYLPAPDTIQYLEAAEKHGLYAVSQLETGWTSYRDSDLKLPEKYLNETERDELLKMWQTGSIYLRGFLMKAKSATYAQRTEIFNEYFYKNVGHAEEVVRSVMNEDNLIGYNTFDEACAMPWFDISEALNRIRQVAHTTDGYHPVMFVSGNVVPEDRVYEGATDIFLPDPYWHPASNIKDTNTLAVVCKRMYLSNERNKRSRKVLWAVPVGWVWSGILSHSRRPIVAAEQHCQNFLAIIHGVRGLFWFRWPMHDIGWRNLTASAKMINVIGPMAVQPRVMQTVTYEKILTGGKREPVPFDTVKDIYPDVHGCVFRDPQGGFVLVAANSTYYPVHAEFTVSGLSGDVSRLFADTVLRTETGTFAEDLAPLAVRAYRLGDLKEPLTLTIAAQRSGPRSALAEPGLVNKWRPDKKNVLPNPSFEQESIKGLPDYHMAIEGGVSIERDPACVKFGAKSVRIEADAEWYFASGGNARGRWHTRGSLAIQTAPQVKKPTPYVWSVWLRGKDGGEAAELQAGGKQEKVTLEKTWKRFSVPMVVPPGLTERDSLRFTIGLASSRKMPHGTFWVDGMQLERGETPTAFEE